MLAIVDDLTFEVELITLKMNSATSHPDEVASVSQIITDFYVKVPFTDVLSFIS